MARRSGSSVRFRPAPEALEVRSLLSVTFQIDYSYDSNGFFNTQARRDLLQAVGDTIGSRLADNLLAIQPGGTNSWTANFNAPGTGSIVSLNNPTVPANTILVFAGGQPLGGSELGIGGSGGFNSSGSAAWNDLVTARGQSGALAATPTDVGPWGGAITFDTNASWYFGKDASGLASSQNDFLSVAFHEFEHLIGFGTSASWQALVSPTNQFLGAASNAAFDGPGILSVSPDKGHWAQGTTDGGTETVMDPNLLQGTRKLLTRLDFAGLQDLGWTLNSDTDGTIPQATTSQLNGLGSNSLVGLSIGPADPSDVDMFKIVGQAGQVFTATTLPHAGGTSVDTCLRLFNAAGTELKAANNGLYDTLSYQLPANGSYYLGVSGAGNAAYSPLEDLARRVAGPTGDYDLSLRLDPVSGGTSADISVQVAAPPTVVQGSPYVYTVTVTNTGPDAAGSVRLTETLPSSVTYVLAFTSGGFPVTLVGGVLTVEFGTLAPNISGSVQITVVPNVTGNLSFTINAAAQQADPSPGNNTVLVNATVSPKPIPPDTTPPTIVGNVRIVVTGKGNKRKVSFIVTFSEAINPGQAQDLQNFQLTKPGRAKRGRPIPRIAIGFRSASYDVGSRTLTLVPAITGGLPGGLRLTVFAGPPHTGIHDLAGNPLDGNRDGVGGDDAVFAVS